MGVSVPKTDITGKTFGSLIAVEYVGKGKWRCKCSCNGEKLVDTGKLINNTVTHCGCQKQKGTTKFKDITGQQFVDWTVEKYLGNQNWQCRCSCGTVRAVKGATLRAGLSTGCGHKRKELENNLTGKYFGEWVVLKYVGNQEYECQCSCKNKTIKIINSRSLTRGNTRSCGCKKKELYNQTMTERYGDISHWKINNTRTEEQIKATTDKDTMLKIIKDLGGFPTSFELAKALNINDTMVLRYIHSMNLEYTVNLYPLKSNGEAELIEYVKTLVNEPIISNDRKILHGKELDVVIESKKIAIEFNGTYWHSYKIKGSKYHLEKSIVCQKEGYRLIHIYEYEWINNNDQIKQYLRDILTEYKEKEIVYARNTEIRSTYLTEEQTFLKSYHLQGYAKSSISFGCYYKNQLIGIMTFGKPRFTDEFEYELIRFAWKPGYIVVGGAEKLFKHFVREYRPTSVITYSNIDKFIGNTYLKLGFKQGEPYKSDPNYVWVGNHNKEVLSRYQTQKHKLLEKGFGDASMTEDGIMESLGYYKIYDCGNYRFIWMRE